MKTATRTGITHTAPSGAQWVHWKLSEPLEGHETVVTSAAYAFGSGPETYIFPANAEGEITGWGELEGSFRGSLDHERAIRGAGYEVAG